MRIWTMKCNGEKLALWSNLPDKLFYLVCVTLLGIGSVQAAEMADAALVKAGERMYREGILPSGKAMRALVRGDVQLQNGPCVTCHRGSGIGASEGQTVVPPVTGEFLYQPRDGQAKQLAYLSDKTARRPAYTDATLARAIRDGIDAAGQPFSGPMPRYALGEEELAALVAYLKSKTSGTAPGVSGEEIHFATVVTQGVAAEKRSAMIELLEAYARDKNAETRHEGRRVRQGPWTMRDYKAFRKWRLHVWELQGSPDTWGRQLDEHYRRQPVFAMLGGLASGAWQPIHDFCEGRALPCLFPNTDLPVVGESGGYSLYLSKGMTLEAEVVASHLRGTAAGPVIQVYGEDAESGVAAAALKKALNHATEQRGATAGTVDYQALLQGKRGVSLVLWQRRPDLASLERWADSLDRVVLSATLADPLPAIPEGLRNKVHLVNPYALASAQAQRQGRVSAWLRAKGIPPGEARIQANTYFAATVAADALMRVAFNFSREYFIERIEDMVDNALTSGAYPHASLGPSQRFVSKGAYIVDLSAESGAGKGSAWIVP